MAALTISKPVVPVDQGHTTTDKRKNDIRRKMNVDLGSIELDQVEEVSIRASIRDFLVCKPHEADAHLCVPIRTLVRKAGGRFSDGTFLAFDAKTKRHIAVTWPRKEADLSELVAQTTEPVENGGQGSTALIDILRLVARRLHALTMEERDSILSKSTLAKLAFGNEKDGLEPIGDRFGEFTDTNGDKIEYTPHSLRANAAHVQPSCIAQSWFQAMALKPGLGDSTTFDELNNAVRCGQHVIDFSSGTLKIRDLLDTDRMLLDAGHNIEDVRMSHDGNFGGPRFNDQVTEARDMMQAWMGENTHFFLMSIAERLFSCVRKEAHVFETPSDRGKTALLDVLLMGLGTYARRLPNDALSGSNKRMAPIHEATLSRQGVRFILHDEADTIDWNYLKSQSNGAAAEEWGVGMTTTLSAAHKATRIVTRNATNGATISAPADCRRKIVLWTGETLLKPPLNTELYERIKAKDETLARAFFLLLVSTFACSMCVRPPMSTALVAGVDIVPEMSSDGGDAGTDTAMELMMTTLTLTSRRIFHELYRPSSTSEGGTKADDVHRAVCARGTMPPMIAKLSLEGFTNDVLCAGVRLPGDGLAVPAVQTKAFTGANGDPKRARVNNVMMCLPRDTIAG